MKSLYHAICIWLLVFALLQFYAENFIYIDSVLMQQPWRLLTAHWVHVGWAHYALNMMALLCLPLVLPHFQIRWLLLTIFILPIPLSLMFYGLYPDVQAYAGFSGVLHGLYTVAAIKCFAIAKERKFCMVILFGIALKLCWEATVGPSSVTAAWIGSAVMVEAHAWGVFMGVCLVLVAWILQQFKFNWHNSLK